MLREGHVGKFFGGEGVERAWRVPIKPRFVTALCEELAVRGEALVAQLFGITMSELLAYNGLVASAQFPYPGSVLRIPPTAMVLNPEIVVAPNVSATSPHWMIRFPIRLRTTRKPATSIHRSVSSCRAGRMPSGQEPTTACR